MQYFSWIARIWCQNWHVTNFWNTFLITLSGTSCILFIKVMLVIFRKIQDATSSCIQVWESRERLEIQSWSNSSKVVLFGVQPYALFYTLNYLKKYELLEKVFIFYNLLHFYYTLSCNFFLFKTIINFIFFKTDFENALFTDLNDVQQFIILLHFRLEFSELLVSDDDCSYMKGMLLNVKH